MDDRGLKIERRIQRVLRKGPRTRGPWGGGLNWWGAVWVCLMLAGVGTADGELRVLRAPEGAIQPRVKAGTDGTVHLVYFKGDAFAGDAYYTKRDAGSEDWAPSVRVNDRVGTVVAAGTVRGPRLALGKGDRPHVAWMSAKGGGADGKAAMYYTRMADDGVSFDPQQNVITRAYGLDGGGTVAADREGRVTVVWHAGEDGEASRRVYAAFSSDGGETFEEEVAVSRAGSGACGCCGIDAAAGPTGHVYTLYRSAGEEVHRDVHLLVYPPGGKPTDVRVDPWELGACPMTTSALLPGSDGVVAAWETDGQVYFARFRTDGSLSAGPFSPPGSPGTRKHPVVAEVDGRTLVAWTDGTGWQRGGRFGWQVFGPDGVPTDERGIADGIPTWSVVAAASVDDAFVLVH